MKQDQPIFTIARSFSKTVQVKQFQPEQYFCSASQVFYEMPRNEEKEKVSNELWEFCKKEVLTAAKERKEKIDRIKKESEGPY